MRRGLGPCRLLLALVVFASGCAELGEPYLGAAPATSTTAPAENTNTVDPIDPAIAETPLAQALPARPEGYVPRLLISTPDGPYLTDARNLTPPPEPEPLLTLPAPEDIEEEPPPPAGAVLTVDDLLRGFVVEEDDGSVLWFPAEADTGQLINDLGGSLFDVGYTDATPEAILLVSERIERVRLVDGDRFLLTQLDPSEELLDLSTTGGLTVLVIGNADCGALRFLSRNGEILDLGGPQTPDCPVTRRPAFGTAALSPDGEAVAYTRIDYRPDGVERSTILAAEELGSGDPLFEDVEVGGSGQVVESLAFDGERAAVLRRTNAGSEVVVVEDGVVRVLDLSTVESPRSVTFARLPVTNSPEVSN